jgi:hypothetical protein
MTVQCSKLLTEAMQRAFGTAKELAYAGGFSVPTAERYRRGDTFPDAMTLIRLISKSRVIADAVLRMAGLDDLSLDLEQARLVCALTELEQKRVKRNEALAVAAAKAEARWRAADAAASRQDKRAAATLGGGDTPGAGTR